MTVAASSMPGVAAPWLVALRVAIARAVTNKADIQSAVSRRWGWNFAETQEGHHRAKAPDQQGGALEPSPAPFGLRNHEANRLAECLDKRDFVDGRYLHKQMPHRAKQCNDDACNGYLVRPVANSCQEVFGVTHRH